MKDSLYRKNGAIRKLGSIDICQNCGEKYTVQSGLQKYCPDCQHEMYRLLDAQQGREYYNTHIKGNTAERCAKRRKYYKENADIINYKRRITNRIKKAAKKEKKDE